MVGRLIQVANSAYQYPLIAWVAAASAAAGLHQGFQLATTTEGHVTISTLPLVSR